MIHSEAAPLITLLNHLLAVCTLPPKEVFTEFLQPTGSHCSSPGRNTAIIRPLFGLLVDKQKN